ncbi:MAG: radical SAM protein [Elusimicrobiota bacterium]
MHTPPFVKDLSSRKPVLRAILAALASRGPDQAALFALARKARDAAFPLRTAEIRSVLELSNVCRVRCRFCNIGSLLPRERYVLRRAEIVSIVTRLYREKGRRVFLFQAGENPSETFIRLVCSAVGDIKRTLPGTSIITCLGSLPRAQYRLLKTAGVDRYILKFETSDPDLYAALKPGDSLRRRLKCLKDLTELGFEVGTGNIVGLPGQEPESLAEDLKLFRRFEPAMVSATAFIPGETSPLAGSPAGNIDLTLNFLALLRLFYPRTLIPSTSSLEKASRGGQYRGLMAGANALTIHDGTPIALRPVFPIYSTDRFTPTEKFIRGTAAKAGLEIDHAPAR